MKATKWKLTWLPDIPDLVPLQLVDFGYLITKKRIEEEDVFEDFVNPESVCPALPLNLQHAAQHFWYCAESTFSNDSHHAWHLSL